MDQGWLRNRRICDCNECSMQSSTVNAKHPIRRKNLVTEKNTGHSECNCNAIATQFLHMSRLLVSVPGGTMRSAAQLWNCSLDRQPVLVTSTLVIDLLSFIIYTLLLLDQCQHIGLFCKTSNLALRVLEMYLIQIKWDTFYKWASHVIIIRPHVKAKMSASLRDHIIHLDISLSGTNERKEKGEMQREGKDGEVGQSYGGKTGGGTGKSVERRVQECEGRKEWIGKVRGGREEKVVREEGQGRTVTGGREGEGRKGR